MKRSALIVTMVLALAAIAAAESGSSLIARDSVGLVVTVKEKYGSYVTDTCTVVMMCNQNFVLVRRKGASSWYPASFHSVEIVKRLSEQASEEAQPLAALSR